MAAIGFGSVPGGADPARAYERPLPSLVKITPPPLPLGVISFPNGKAINLSVNIAAGAFHPREAGPSLIWTVTARGPVIPCRSAKALIGLDEKTMCNGDLDADIAPLPSFAPTIYGLDIGADNVAHVNQLIAIKDKDGKPLSGLANDDPDDTVGTYDVMGKALVEEQNGIHPGGIARLSDGTFWIGERYAPSLLHVSGEGTIIERIVPEGTESDYATVRYPVIGGLPAILARVDSNAEVSCITLTPDERTLYVALKSPPAVTEPGDRADGGGQPYLRIFAFDIASRRITGQFAYALEEPAAFAADGAVRPRAQAEVHLVEIIALSKTRLLTVERVARSTKLLIADLTETAPLAETPVGAAPDADLDAAIETMTRSRFAASGLRAVAKTTLFDADVLAEDPSAKAFERIESVARMSDRELILITDNAFGIDGERVRMFRLTFPTAALQ